jgi:hypothetical protein
VYAISGQVDKEIGCCAPIPADEPDWQFQRPTALVTLGTNQSMLANVTASLGLQRSVIEKPTRQKARASKIEPSFNEFGFGVCFQSTAGGGEQPRPPTSKASRTTRESVPRRRAPAPTTSATASRARALWTTTTEPTDTSRSSTGRRTSAVSPTPADRDRRLVPTTIQRYDEEPARAGSSHLTPEASSDGGAA